MAKKTEVRFEEAENNKWIILSSVAAGSGVLAWLLRNSIISMSAVSILAVYLLTGDRYQWLYIMKRTFFRDWAGLKVVLATMLRIWLWEKKEVSVVTRWSDVWQMNPEKNAFVMGDRALTFRQGEEFSNRMARYFKRQGFKGGEVIALFMETQPEYVFMFLGLAKMRVTTALLNTNLRGDQLVYCLKIAGCKALIYSHEMSDAIQEIYHEIKDMPLFQFNSPERPSAPITLDAAPLATELNEMSRDIFVDEARAKPRDTFLYIYTSGTTGFPKAAIITNIRYLLIPLGVHNAARLSSSDVLYDPLPLHHTAGGVLGAGQAIVLGCTVVLRKKFSASNYWTDAAKYGCTATQYIGEICRYLLSVPPSPNDQKHKIRIIIGNGLRPQIWEEFVKRFKIPNVLEFYGATEGNSNLINLDSKVGAIGFLNRAVSSVYPLTLVKCDQLTGEIFRNDDGRCIICGPLEPGLLLGKIDASKAILTFAGYADKTESEKKMVRNVKVEGDCYFNTGDIMEMDHYGYFYFKDRTGDTFRWRGENVSTAEVEGVISKLASLHDTVVYGVSIPNVEGKTGMAAIMDPDKKLDLKELGNNIKSALPVYARPLFIRIISEMPITATFKLKKKELMGQGFNISIVKDPMYFLDLKTSEYIPLTPKLFDEIMTGQIKF